MVKHFTVLGYEFKNVFLMTELNVKIEIRKTAIQRKIKKKNPVYQNSHKSKVSMAQRPRPMVCLYRGYR